MTVVAFYRSDRPSSGGRYGNCLQPSLSQDAVRDEITKIVERDIDTVVMGYGEEAFAEAEFRQSTAHTILENHDVPVVFVP